MIDFSLSEQQKAFQKTARDFAAKEIAPMALDYDRNPRFPGDIIQKAHAAGLMNLTCPKEYGGQGLGLVDSSLINEEMNAACVAITGMIGINSLACGPILVGGSDEQKRRFLLPLNQSGKTASFGLTEREAGSDAGGLKTRAKLEGDHYVLNGQKCFITNASYRRPLYHFCHPSTLPRGPRASAASSFPASRRGFPSARWRTRWGSGP